MYLSELWQKGAELVLHRIQVTIPALYQGIQRLLHALGHAPLYQ
jgi:hypothetical protein